VAKWNAPGLEEALSERRVPACIVRSEAEWLAHEHGRWLAARPVIEVEKIGDSAPEAPRDPGHLSGQYALSQRPLAGVRVLDLAHVICGPMLARFLGEHGAEVLRLRSPYRKDSDAVNFDTAWGKRTALVDLKTDAGVATARRLLSGADVLVQSYRPGVLERLGLSVAEAAKLRPGLVYVSASCYGSGGPWRERGGYDPLGQTAAGIALDEAVDGKPQAVSTVTLNDYLTAYLGAAGAAVALARRAREGGSWHVKVSLTRSAMWIKTFGLLADAKKHAHHPYTDPGPARLVTQSTPFGRLTALAPGVEYSATPATWSRVPEPAGLALPEWLPG
jgi:crotonobetainyl-CoA:carnitine CoA-transferase CaiB-like acyl-CoA transferase